MKREVNLDDSWQISIDGTEYDDVRLSEFHMPATKRGTEVILKRTLPEETYKQASLRTLVRYSAIQVSIDHDIFFEKGIEEYNNHDILGSGYIWASLPENYAGKELEIRLLTGEKHLHISALFHQDIILHIPAVYQWQVRSMHSLIRVWFLNPFRLPNSQCGAYNQQKYKYQCCFCVDCILQILFLSYRIV